MRAADFEPIDEFHFRGRQATSQLLEKLALAPGANVLDIGCGLGGVTRTIAEEANAKVTGIDSIWGNRQRYGSDPTSGSG
ncbi:SAM-dependent methyltransferase [Ruegeria arenilitoris]|uniref:SAM-dependent methyltransferase n=1 Tax=Ruegeria arenilitoris TaxID=1173585 RepID=UPI00346442FA